MDMKSNLENVFPVLPSYYTSRNPPSEIQVKWVLKFIYEKLWNESSEIPVEDEILHDFGIVTIEPDYPEKGNVRIAILVEKQGLK